MLEDEEELFSFLKTGLKPASGLFKPEASNLALLDLYHCLKLMLQFKLIDLGVGMGMGMDITDETETMVMVAIILGIEVIIISLKTRTIPPTTNS